MSGPSGCSGSVAADSENIIAALPCLLGHGGGIGDGSVDSMGHCCNGRLWMGIGAAKIDFSFLRFLAFASGICITRLAADEA